MGRPAVKKEAIERAALELFVEKGIDGTTVREIAARAGVTEGALYRHHPGKEDLARYLYRECFRQFIELLRTDLTYHPEEHFNNLLRGYIKQCFNLFDKDPAAFRYVLVLDHPILNEMRSGEEGPMGILRRIIGAGIENKTIPPQDVHLGTHCLIGMVIYSAKAVLEGDMYVTATSLAHPTTERALLMLHCAD